MGVDKHQVVGGVMDVDTSDRRHQEHDELEPEQDKGLKEEHGPERRFEHASSWSWAGKGVESSPSIHPSNNCSPQSCIFPALSCNKVMLFTPKHNPLYCPLRYLSSNIDCDVPLVSSRDVLPEEQMFFAFNVLKKCLRWWNPTARSKYPKITDCVLPRAT